VELYKEFVAQKYLAPTINPIREFDLQKQIEAYVSECTYEMHESYNVFKALKALRYHADRPAFVKKYRNLWAISKTLQADSMIELGVLSGGSADVFLDANPTMKYRGIDDFLIREEDVGKMDIKEETGGGFLEDCYGWVKRLLVETRGYPHVILQRSDLRNLHSLPSVEFVNVDAAHDFHSQRRDLELAITAAPRFIYIDDFDGTSGEKAATEHFISKFRNSILALIPFDHTGGGVLLLLEGHDRESLIQNVALQDSIETLMAGWWEYRRIGYDSRMLELLPGGLIGNGCAELEVSWRVDIENGATYVSLSGKRVVTCRLGEVSKDLYRGRWNSFERMPVELVRSPSS
jgi:hypothetical protein